MSTKVYYLFLICIISQVSFAGDESGHGGDSYASEFIATAKSALEELGRVPAQEIEPLKIETFREAVLHTEVHSEGTLILDGNVVDAINYPGKKQIQINRERWETLRGQSQTAARYNLVLHEYLGIMGIDDSQYAISQKLLKTMHFELLAQIWNSEHTIANKKYPAFGVTADMGIGFYTGGLGQSNDTGLYSGVRISSYLTQTWAIDLSVHRSSSTDTVQTLGGGLAFLDTALTPVLLGIRHHFVWDRIPLLNELYPYLTAGGGVYFRSQKVVGHSSDIAFDSNVNDSQNPGVYGGLGTQMVFWNGEINVGIGLLYHYIFFEDRETTWNGKIASDSRSGGYLSSSVTMEYVF